MARASKFVDYLRAGKTIVGLVLACMLLLEPPVFGGQQAAPTAPAAGGTAPPTAENSVRFAVLGDTGTGDRQQYEVAVNTAHQSNQSVVGAQAALESARAQTALAREALDNTIIRSPFAGHVSDRPVAPGESVSTTTKVATIQRINPIKLQLQLLYFKKVI